MPFLYKGAIVAAQPNEIAVEVSRKAKTELGLSNAGVSAFDAIDAAIGRDAKLSDAIRGIYDGAAFRGAVEQMLPNYTGSVFEGVTLASRAAAAQLREPAGEFSEEGKWGYWLTPLGWDASKGTRLTRSYDVRGWGVSGGIEHKTDAGNFGASLSYMSGRDNEGSAVNRVNHGQYELAGFWRARWGALAAQARGSAAFLSFDSQRQFDGVVGTEAVQRRATADWKGMLYSGSGSVSWEHWVGRFNVRPILAVDYYRLNEDGYRETGGGTGYDLTVRKRTSDELALTASVAAGINFGGNDRYSQWSRLEVEGGRRERIAGTLGNTVASFGDGTPFILRPEARDGGWVGRVRAITGTSEIRLSGEVNAEQRLGNVALSARAALQFAFDGVRPRASPVACAGDGSPTLRPGGAPFTGACFVYTTALPFHLAGFHHAAHRARGRFPCQSRQARPFPHGAWRGRRGRGSGPGPVGESGRPDGRADRQSAGLSLPRGRHVDDRSLSVAAAGGVARTGLGGRSGADPPPGTERAVEARQTAEQVAATLASLGERPATVFRRVRVDGIAQRQVAAELRVSISTVESDLRMAAHALAALKERIG